MGAIQRSPSGPATSTSFAAASDGLAATPVLIVHGLSYFSYDWIGPASALASDREVVAIDMRGFGQSGWSPCAEL